MRQRLFFSINCECLTVSRLLTAASCTSGHNRRAEAKAYYLHGPDFRFIISDRLTKGRPKSFEDIGYRSIRCLICVETWTSTSSIIDNRSVIVHGSDDHENTPLILWPILISQDDVFVFMSLEVLPNRDRHMADEKYFRLRYFHLKCCET